jgi:hypothetical protein
MASRGDRLVKGSDDMKWWKVFIDDRCLDCIQAHTTGEALEKAAITWGRYKPDSMLMVVSLYVQ